jgi:uncharacterized membrane protein YqiK
VALGGRGGCVLVDKMTHLYFYIIIIIILIILVNIINIFYLKKKKKKVESGVLVYQVSAMGNVTGTATLLESWLRLCPGVEGGVEAEVCLRYEVL